jgi:hypothetical protein
MTLINGPLNGVEIEDLGTVTQKLSIHKPRPDGAIECGYSIYEPTQDRALSFWRENVWDGATLVEDGA